MNKNLLLLIGIILLSFGLFRPQLNVSPANSSTPSVSVDVPSENGLKESAQKIVDLMRNSNSFSVKTDSAQLRDLYINLAVMISLDGKDTVINTTEEIRKANSISGHLLQAVGVDLKGKYNNLAKECQNVIVGSIGDENITLSPELRKKASESFMALAWAFNELSR